MSKLLQEVSNDQYTRYGGTLVIPYLDLIMGIPKHQANLTSYYKSAGRTIRGFYFISITLTMLIMMIVFNLLNLSHLLGFESLVILAIIVFTLSQINNFRKMIYFKDNVYSKVCKKHFAILLLQTIVFIIIGGLVYSNMI